MPKKLCPVHNTPMFNVYFGDDKERWRCMKCDAIYDENYEVVEKE